MARMSDQPVGSVYETFCGHVGRGDLGLTELDDISMSRKTFPEQRQGDTG